MQNAARRLLLVVALAISLAACAREPEEPTRPSILFLSLDTFAAGHMSLFGYERQTTPALDRLAEDAVVFEQCWANAPWTTPSYMSQFTGLQPIAFREPLEPESQRWALAKKHTTLAERLRAAGYRTAAFIDNPNLGARLGLGQGFEVYDGSAARIGLEQEDGGIDHVAQLALNWLDARDPGEPFFLFLQAADAHGPYLAGSPPAGLFPKSRDPAADRVLPVALGDAHILGAIQKHVAAPLLEAGQDSMAVRPLINAYDEGIRAMDAALAGLFEQLDSRGLLDDTIVVLSADHGESLVEHESYFNHRLLHAEELHVPLVFWLPGNKVGRRIPTDVQLVDLYPTLLELVDLGSPGPVHGRSLAAAIRGADLADRPSMAFGDFQEARSITVGAWKLVETNPSLQNAGLVGFLSSPRAQSWIAKRFPELEGKVYGTPDFPPALLAGVDVSELFEEAAEDLGGPFRKLFQIADDPEERFDLAARYPARVAELLELLDAESERAREAYIPGEAAAAMDPKTRKELEKMGYLGG